MKADYKRVPTRFAPDTRFEVKPTSPNPFRARQETELERLKDKLLSERQKEFLELELADNLRRAASEAVALAWVTAYPLLVFPALFEERALAASLQAKRQEQIRQRSRELLAA